LPRLFLRLRALRPVSGHLEVSIPGSILTALVESPRGPFARASGGTGYSCSSLPLPSASFVGALAGAA
jgi:hypothetical protein